MTKEISVYGLPADQKPPGVGLIAISSSKTNALRVKIGFKRSCILINLAS